MSCLPSEELIMSCLVLARGLAVRVAEADHAKETALPDAKVSNKWDTPIRHYLRRRVRQLAGEMGAPECAITPEQWELLAEAFRAAYMARWSALFDLDDTKPEVEILIGARAFGRGGFPGRGVPWARGVGSETVANYAAEYVERWLRARPEAAAVDLGFDVAPGSVLRARVNAPEGLRDIWEDLAEQAMEAFRAGGWREFLELNQKKSEVPS